MGEGVLYTFTLDESGILMKDDKDGAWEFNSGYGCRFTIKETGEVVQPEIRADKIYYDILRYINRRFDWLGLDFPKVRMIRWISKEAFICKQYSHTKWWMAMGYITAPKLYPPELAFIYDEYIRKNVSNLFTYVPFFSDYEDYIALVNHIFAICKPSKATITAALKPETAIKPEGKARRMLFELEQEISLRKMLADHFIRLYPKSACAEIDV